MARLEPPTRSITASMLAPAYPDSRNTSVAAWRIAWRSSSGLRRRGAGVSFFMAVLGSRKKGLDKKGTKYYLATQEGTIQYLTGDANERSDRTYLGRGGNAPGGGMRGIGPTRHAILASRCRRPRGGGDLRRRARFGRGMARGRLVARLRRSAARPADGRGARGEPHAARRRSAHARRARRGRRGQGRPLPASQWSRQLHPRAIRRARHHAAARRGHVEHHPPGAGKPLLGARFLGPQPRRI